MGAGGCSIAHQSWSGDNQSAAIWAGGGGGLFPSRSEAEDGDPHIQRCGAKDRWLGLCTLWRSRLHVRLCAGFLDVMLRAAGSSIEAGARRELAVILGDDVCCLTCVQIQLLPVHGKNKATPPSVWAQMKWYINRYSEAPRHERVREVSGA